MQFKCTLVIIECVRPQQANYTSNQLELLQLVTCKEICYVQKHADQSHIHQIAVVNREQCVQSYISMHNYECIVLSEANRR